jgi:hypothetical protein
MPNGWQTEHKLSMAALIVAFLALAASVVVPLIIMNVQFKEDVLLAPKKCYEPRIHVEEITKERGIPPFVSQIALWIPLRIVNNSHEPVSILSTEVQDAEGHVRQAYDWVCDNVDYDANRMVLAGLTQLPVTLAAKESRNLEILVRLPVERKLGIILFLLLRDSSAALLTQSDSVLFDDKEVDFMETATRQRVSRRLAQYGIALEELHMGSIQISRNIVHRASGQVVVRDSVSPSCDGYFNKSAMSLYLEAERELDSLSVKMPLIFAGPSIVRVVAFTGKGTVIEGEYPSTLPVWDW